MITLTKYKPFRLDHLILRLLPAIFEALVLAGLVIAVERG